MDLERDHDGGNAAHAASLELVRRDALHAETAAGAMGKHVAQDAAPALIDDADGEGERMRGWQAGGDRGVGEDDREVTAVVAQARSASPAPQAVPTAAVTQTSAAVVRPRTMSPRTKMRSPPPMKPMPETTWAGTREGSRALFPGASTSPKRYLLTSRSSAAPTHPRHLGLGVIG